MDNTRTLKREPRVLIFGTLLVALGSVLLLNRLHVLYFQWNAIWWIVGACFGAFLAVDGFARKKRGRIFWGTLLFFFSAYWVLARWYVFHHYGFFVMPVIFFSLGLAFLALYASQPREYGLIIPAVVFCSVSTLMMLWWWEAIEWYEVRYAVRTYWPLIFVLWGVALLLRRKSVPAENPANGPQAS